MSGARGRVRRHVIHKHRNHHKVKDMHKAQLPLPLPLPLPPGVVSKSANGGRTDAAGTPAPPAPPQPTSTPPSTSASTSANSPSLREMMLRAAVYSVAGLKHGHGLFEHEVVYSVRVCMANTYSTFDQATLNGKNTPNVPLNGNLNGPHIGARGKRAGPNHDHDHAHAHAHRTTDGADHFTCAKDGYREMRVGKHAIGVGMGEDNVDGGRKVQSEGGEGGEGGEVNLQDELDHLPPCFVYLLADVGTPKVYRQ